jgi:succinyldiaminopimelate transaminase
VAGHYRGAVRINPVLTRLGDYPIAAVHEKVAELRGRGRRVIDFSIGDPREPTPPFIRQALIDAVPVSSQYPLTAGIIELRQAVADYLSRRFGVEVDPDTQVMPTSGSKEAVFSAPLAFVDRDADDVVVYGTPGYPIYERGALFAGAETHEARLAGDFVLRPGDVPEPIWGRAAIAWTCTPHNPTGAVTDDATLTGLLDMARASDTWLFSDECYADVYEPLAFPDGPGSLLQAAGAGSRGVLAFFSCSKRSGMTGYRSGAMVGDAAAISALKKLRTATGTASPDFVQAAAVAAWSDDAHAAERRGIFSAKRAVLRKAFESVGHRVVASQAGLYLWVDVGDDVAVSGKLLDDGVVVSPGRAFGAGGEGYLRLALVPTLEECEAAVEVVQECLQR